MTLLEVIISPKYLGNADIATVFDFVYIVSRLMDNLGLPEEVAVARAWEREYPTHHHFDD